MSVLFYLKSVTLLFYSIVPFPLSWYFKSLYVFIIDKSLCYKKYIKKAVDEEEISLMKQFFFFFFIFLFVSKQVTFSQWDLDLNLTW